MCPCGSGLPESQCCGPLLAGAPAPTALALMRSRYTAYVRGAVDYLVATHASHEPLGRIERGWVSLEILATERGGPDDDEGIVEFVARTATGALHERSRFERIDGRWSYVAAEKSKPVKSEKVGRN